MTEEARLLLSSHRSADDRSRSGFTILYSTSTQGLFGGILAPIFILPRAEVHPNSPDSFETGAERTESLRENELPDWSGIFVAPQLQLQSHYRIAHTFSMKLPTNATALPPSLPPPYRFTPSPPTSISRERGGEAADDAGRRGEQPAATMDQRKKGGSARTSPSSVSPLLSFPSRHTAGGGAWRLRGARGRWRHRRLGATHGSEEG